MEGKMRLHGMTATSGFGKGFAIGIAALLAMSTARAQDDHFEYSNPFGSDGFNQPGLTVEEKNYRAEQELWMNYVFARTCILRNLPRLEATMKDKSGPYSIRPLKCAYYGNLLERMAELRAFSGQNPDLVLGNEKDEIAKIDHVLRGLGLRYVAGAGVDPATGRSRSSGQLMADYCDKVGPDKIAVTLRPILYRPDDKLRPMP
jgi:hypothetical protein